METVEEVAPVDVHEPDLSFDRSDLERRLLFPAGRFTSAGPLLPVVGALILTVGAYAALAAWPDSTLHQMFTQRSVIPYIIVFMSAWAIMILLVKQRKVRLQARALRIRILPDQPGFVLNRHSAEQVLARLYQAVDDPRHFLLTRRIQNTMSSLHNMGRIADVDEILRSQADADEGVMDSSYTFLRGLIWAIPVLGFIGTVLGLSVALGSFGRVLAEAGEITELRGALQRVTGGLSTAFETTLQGLVAALCIHMWMIAVRRREEQFMDECRDYCQRNVVARLRIGEERSEQ